MIEQAYLDVKAKLDAAWATAEEWEKGPLAIAALVDLRDACTAIVRGTNDKRPDPAEYQRLKNALLNAQADIGLSPSAVADRDAASAALDALVYPRLQEGNA